MTEADLYAPIVAALLRLPRVLSVTRVQSGKVKVRGGWMHGAKTGTPDFIVACKRGKTVWVEVKSDDGEPTEEQEAWHSKHAAHGHRVIVVRSPQDAVNAVMEVPR